MDAARLADDDFDRQTANLVAGAYGLPASAAQFVRRPAPAAQDRGPARGAFLRKLAGVRASRVLVSTRLYPADLQAMTGTPCPAVPRSFLPGLSEDDALELWRAFGVSGGRETLLPLFARFERHPLLIQALASQVAHYRPAPGDFERWRRDHPGLFAGRPAAGAGQVARAGIRAAWAGRQGAQSPAHHRRVSHAGRYDTLVALLVGKRNPCRSENAWTPP